VALELLAEGVDREETVREALGTLERLTNESLDDVMWSAVLMTPLICGGLLDISLRGWTPDLGMALATQAKLHLWRGDVSAALADGGEALAVSEDPISTAHAAAFLAEARRLRGEVDVAWGILENHGLAGELPGMWPYPLLLADRSMLHLDLRRDPHRALVDLEACRQGIESMEVRCPSLVPWSPRMALVLHALGRNKEGARLAAGEVEAARRWGEPGTLGEALRARAIFLEGSDRIVLLQEAVTTLDGSERALDLAGALVELGGALPRVGQRHQAQEPLRWGLAIADRAGALVLSRRADEELRAAGGRPRRAAIGGRDALTPSEMRVATLASEGRSNPDIARLLFVTRRTVETHLTQRYAKLGVRSRNDLERALQDPPDPR
jgi:DNA-binding CsgD family transcriptional regulator